MIFSRSLHGNIRQSLFVILPLALLLLVAALAVLPTFDDWNTLSSPNTDADWPRYFLPNGSFWRPFDALSGYISGCNHRLFPALNHVLTVGGHALSTGFVYAIATRHLRLARHAAMAAALFFMLSPCAWATVWACDSINQTYSQLLGLVALWGYLNGGRRRYLLWAVGVWMAALSKENGLAWAIVPPIVAWGLSPLTARHSPLTAHHSPLTARHSPLTAHLSLGIAIALSYAAVRLLLPQTGDYNPDYQHFSLLRRAEEVALMVANTWTAADYLSLLYAPARQPLTTVVTLALSLPLTAMLAIAFWRHRRYRLPWALLVAATVAVSPNLLLSLSMMNAYAQLALSALLMGWLVGRCRLSAVRRAVALWLVAASFVGAHYWYCSWQSGRTGRETAQRLLTLTGEPVESAFCLLIDTGEPKFSSFCVRRIDTIGWGLAVLHETAYQWPTTIDDLTIDNPAEADAVAARALAEGYQVVWIVSGDGSVSVRR